MFIVFAAMLFEACNDGKSKEGDNKSDATRDDIRATGTGDDVALTARLSSKRLSSTYKEPKYDLWDKFKFNAGGTGTNKNNASAKWEIKGAEFVFMASWI